jgi:hypothetical protein
MKNAFVPAIVVILSVLAIGATVAPAISGVFGKVSAALVIAPAEDSAGRPINQR